MLESKTKHPYPVDKLPQIYCDAFISIGNACRPAYWLRKNDLRKQSMPFDWMMNYDLNVVWNTITQGTGSWFKKYEEEPHDSPFNRRIIDKHSGMISLHDFTKRLPTYEQIPEVQSKYARRYKNFIKILKTSSSICFVSNRTDDISAFVDFAQKITSMFHNLRKVIFVNVRQNASANDVKEYYIDHKIYIYDISYNDINENGSSMTANPDFWLGNSTLWTLICQRLTLESFSNKLLRFIKHIFQRKNDVHS